MRGVKKKKVNETDLFSGIKILLVDKQKDKTMMALKENLSLISNIEVDNSTLVRSMIEYFSRNQDELLKLKDFVVEQKGYNLLRNIITMVVNGNSDEEIYAQIGVNVNIVKEVRRLEPHEIREMLEPFDLSEN